MDVNFNLFGFNIGTVLSWLFVLTIVFAEVKLVNIAFARIKSLFAIDTSNDDLPAESNSLLNEVTGITRHKLNRLNALLLDAGRIVIIVGTVYISLLLIALSIDSHNTTALQLMGYIATPLKQVVASTGSFIPSLITIVIYFFLFRYVSRLVDITGQRIYANKLDFMGIQPELARPISLLIRILLWLFFIAIIYPLLPGSGSPSFKAISLLAGALISFGGSTTVSNLISGLVLAFMRPYKLGDWIEVNHTTGEVVENNLSFIRLKTVKNEFITIPNNKILQNEIINFSSRSETDPLILHTEVTIGYDVPHAKVESALLSAASKCELIYFEQPPFVLIKSLGDMSICYELNAYTLHVKRRSLAYSQLHSAILNELHNNNIEILSPDYRVVRNVNESTIPKH